MKDHTQDYAGYIHSKLKQFKLVVLRERYPELIEAARAKGMDYEDFLLRLIEIEDAEKKERRQAKLKATDNINRLWYSP
jgi:hypothetical protein